MKFKGNRKRSGEKNEKVSPVFLGKLPAGKLFCKYPTTTKRHDKSNHSLYFDAHFFTNFRVSMVAAIDMFSYLSTGFGWILITYGPVRLISVYIGPSPREGKKDRREKKCPNNPNPHLLQAQ